MASASKFILRLPEKSDAYAVAKCRRDAIISKAAPYYGGEQARLWADDITPERLARTEQEIEQKDLIYILAESDEGIIGFGIVIPERNELRAIYVKPNRAGSVGSVIMNELLNRSRERKIAFLEMDASVNAVSFYENHGFVSVQRSVHQMDNGMKMDCMKMRIDLSPK